MFRQADWWAAYQNGGYFDDWGFYIAQKISLFICTFIIAFKVKNNYLFYNSYICSCNALTLTAMKMRKCGYFFTFFLLLFTFCYYVPNSDPNSPYNIGFTFMEINKPLHLM